MSHKIQIDESVIFVSVICHRRSDTNSRIIFFSVHLQTLDSEIFFYFDFYRNNFLSVINQQIHFATAPLRSIWILCICYCCQAICVCLCLLYNSVSCTLKPNHHNFFTSWKVLKNISYRYKLYQKCQSSIYRFSIILKFEFYIFLWVQRLGN